MPKKMTSFLITGANRGLGLWMATILASKPASEVSVVIAAVRKSSDALERLIAESGGRVRLLVVQITEEESVEKFAVEVAQILPHGLDVLINNAGIMQYSPNSELGAEAMNNLKEHWEINVNSVHLVSRALLPILRKGKKKTIVNVSSAMASITHLKDYMFQPTPAYKISKAALNMMTAQYAAYLEKDGFTVFSICAGWARTEMGSEAADLDPKESAECLLNRVLSVTKVDNGKFFSALVPSWESKGGSSRYDGRVLPW
ncbi:hypothetical protein N7471_013868 [Penicillium samsonianum]|uniref:uncharacterized protein n=1 Tax=Penicillium samsonianum TaxID=1882272 RepID=UPI00254854FD|nr:uncharacterized protein N7471_013868 [Penicillium samsonianum]KAJ6118401.1 hypothetical protein N7471_013868 [Penicillium samsonianum]